MTTTTVYYKLRITLDTNIFSDGATDCPFQHYIDGLESQTRHFWNFLQGTNYIYDKATVGFECKDKCGHLCRPHFHAHFDSRTKKDTVVHGIKAWYNDYFGKNLKGNKLYSLKIEPFPDNDLKFFSYTLKQGGFSASQGFSDEEMKVMKGAAAQLYATSCEINLKKADHAEEKNTLYDRLEEYLKGLKDQPSLTDVVNFYVEEKRPINPTTLKGHWALYQLRTGIISSSQYAFKIQD